MCVPHNWFGFNTPPVGGSCNLFAPSTTLPVLGAEEEIAMKYGWNDAFHGKYPNAMATWIAHGPCMLCLFCLLSNFFPVHCWHCIDPTLKIPFRGSEPRILEAWKMEDHSTMWRSASMVTHGCSAKMETLAAFLGSICGHWVVMRYLFSF